MPPSAALIARDARILAGYRAGASLVDLAFAENTSTEVVRRVLRDHSIDPGPRRPAPSIPDCLKDPDWLRAEYATKGAKQIAP